MAKKDFECREKLKAIYVSDNATVIVGKGGVMDIEVVFENGQMAGVPWAYVTYADREDQKWNLALCQGVLLPKKEEMNDVSNNKS